MKEQLRKREYGGALQAKSGYGKDGTPAMSGTRDISGGVLKAQADIRLENRFFEGNTVGGLREKQREGEMRRYRPSYREKEKGAAPGAFASMENAFGEVELGMDKRKEELTLAVGAKRRADRESVPGIAAALDANRAQPVQSTVGERGKALAGAASPARSAVAVKASPARGYRDAFSILEKLKEGESFHAVEEILPFISTNDEVWSRQEITSALAQQKDPNARQALSLRLGHVERIRRLKEQRRLEFILALQRALQRQMRRSGNGGGDWLLRAIQELLPGEIDQGKEAGRPEDGESI